MYHSRLSNASAPARAGRRPGGLASPTAQPSNITISIVWL